MLAPDVKILSPSGTFCLSLAPLSPLLGPGWTQERGLGPKVRAIWMVALQIFYSKPCGCHSSHCTSENRSTRSLDLHFGPCSLRPSISVMPFLEVTNGWIDFLGSHPLTWGSSQWDRAFLNISCNPKGKRESESIILTVLPGKVFISQKKGTKEFMANICSLVSFKRHAGPFSPPFVKWGEWALLNERYEGCRFYCESPLVERRLSLPHKSISVFPSPSVKWV